jgi:DNA-binding NtrC family response regulator
MAGRGSELLIADGVQRDREGMRKYFDERGFVCTAVGDGESARKFATAKFFPVALIDLDVDQPNGGLDLLRFIRERSPETAVVLLVSHKSYDGAVAALRAGAIDVVRKSQDEVEHLAKTISRAAERYQSAANDDLLRDVRRTLDESFKVMLGLSRKVYAHLSMAAVPLKPRVMIVDGDGEFMNQLAKAPQVKDWEISAEMTGGSALDRGMSQRIDIVAIRNELPDLRGSMVLRSIQAQRGEVLGLLYTAENGGRIERVEQGTTEDTERPFKGAMHLAIRVQTLADELGTRAQERRFIQAFRNDHEDFLRRFAELKLKIDRLITD